MRTAPVAVTAGVLGVALMALGCGGGASTTMLRTAPLGISVSAPSVTAAQDGTPGTVTVTVLRPPGDTNNVNLSASGVPAGVSTQITPPGSGDTGTVTFTPATPGAPAAGTYSVTLTASDGTTKVSTPLALVIAIVATIQSSVNTNVGQAGALNAFMSTSFQPAEWDAGFFAANPGGVAALGALNSEHIRLQPVSQGTPQKSDRSWDFSTLDAVLNPVIGVTDQSPELQLAVGPAWMDDANGHLLPGHFQDFAAYAADVVEYYDTAGGFTDAQGHNHVHSAGSVTPVADWGIFNEPNINGLTADQYVTLYNTVVPAMQAAPSSVPLTFVAVELADFGSEPENYMPTFVAGVTAQVDVVATHFYSSCNQADSDAQVMSTVPGFASDVRYIYAQLQTNPALANVPVWVTENNVNADYDAGGGVSACNGGPFTTDRRGSSAFFAAWRPYVFSQLVQAGAHSLYHWDFDADPQYGEVDFNTGKTYLSYWVDYTLQRYYPACPAGALCLAGSPQSILNLTATETSSVEVLATRGPGDSTVVMIANHAVNASGDNNGPGAPRTVLVDLSALGAFSSATELTIDAGTDPGSGPSAVAVTPAARMAVTLDGYGVTFLQLQP